MSWRDVSEVILRNDCFGKTVRDRSSREIDMNLSVDLSLSLSFKSRI